MTEVWIADLEKLGTIPGTQMELLDDDDASRFRKLRSGPERRRFLVSRILLRKALSTVADADPRDWRFETDATGRPCLSPDHGLDNVDFNISRAGNAVVVAVSTTGPVGVDLELLSSDEETTPDVAILQECVFSERELDSLDNLPDEARERKLMRLWTVKEAYAKLRGVDRRLDAFDDEIEASPWRVRVPAGRGAGASRHLDDLRLEGRDLMIGEAPYHLALASLQATRLNGESSSTRIHLVDAI